MKTHDFAKALVQLSKMLRALPNQDLEDFGSSVSRSVVDRSADVGVSLSALAALSKFSRGDWEKVVQDFDLPVSLRPRDASRDVMGKILTYLAENDAERQRVALKSRVESKEPSELSNALKFLLSNG